MSGTKKSFQERLKEGIVLCGEGYLFELEKRGYVQVGPYVPEVVLEHPDVVKQLHREFLRAGSDIVEAFTYYAHREKMRLIGREDDLEKLNRTAIRLAKEVAQEGNALVAGNICNTNIWADKGEIDDYEKVQEQARQMFAEQVAWAKEEGVDLIIAETFDYAGEAIAATKEIVKSGIPAVVTFAIHLSGKTRDNLDPVDALGKLAEAGALVVGLNCARGPATMYDILQKAHKALPQSVYLAALPVPYCTNQEKPTFQQLCSHEHMYTELEPHTCTRWEMAEWAKKFADIGVRYMGVCCGGTPYMLRAMAEAIGRRPPASKYSPDLSKHFAYGNDSSLKKWNTDYAKKL